MALPRAVATLGVVPGALLILLVYILTFITISVLSRCHKVFITFSSCSSRLVTIRLSACPGRI